MKNHRQKQDYEAMEPSKKKIFLEKNQVRDKTNTKHELKRKQFKYKAMDTTKKQDMLNKKAEHYKTMDIAKETRSVEQKSRTIQNKGYC